MSNIRFFAEDIDFTIKHKTKIRQWISKVISSFEMKASSINYIFTSDNHLLEINRNYLNHDTYTDIITFDNSVIEKYIEADIYISIDRIKENANTMDIPFVDELHRVMLHGVLHIMGYKDKTPTEKKEMRKKENHYLALRF